MATINGINWSFPYSTEAVGKLADLTNVTPETRAYYVLGNLLPYLQGSAFNQALTYLYNNQSSLGNNLMGGLSDWSTAQNALGQLTRQNYKQETPGYITSQAQRASAATGLSDFVNKLQQGSATNDKWGSEMSWLRSLSNLAGTKPQTAAEWADYNDQMNYLKSQAASNVDDSSSSAYSDLLTWFANPAYNAPTVAAGPGKSVSGGARSWWG